jgi:hypothetical protein
MYPLPVSLLPREIEAKYGKTSNATLIIIKGSATSETLDGDKGDGRFEELHDVTIGA